MAPSSRAGAMREGHTRPGFRAVTKEEGQQRQELPLPVNGVNGVSIHSTITHSPRPSLCRRWEGGNMRDGYAPGTAKPPPGSCGPSPEHHGQGDSTPTEAHQPGTWWIQGAQPPAASEECALRHTQPPGDSRFESERARAEPLRQQQHGSQAATQHGLMGRTVPAVRPAWQTKSNKRTPLSAVSSGLLA